MNENDFVFFSFKMTDFMHGPGTGKYFIFNGYGHSVKRFAHRTVQPAELAEKFFLDN